jgi:hypothetical protein
MRSPNTDWVTIGAVSSAGSLIVSLTDIEQWLRIATLVAGLLLTLISIAGAIRAWRRGAK